MKTPPYLNALRAFEASARHKSFSAAAAELHVTPAAVGQLVRSLEDWLGSPLFHRGTRPGVRLVPTEAAERALPDIRAGFDSLTLGLERLKEGLGGGVLTVAVSPSFAAKWLLPRIERFRSEWPTDLRLDTDLKGVDFVAHRIDIGVRYGAGTWPGLVADKLMDEEVYPVCSPNLLAADGPMAKPSDLKRVPLIHDVSMGRHTGFPTWDTWLREAGERDVRTPHGLRINNSAAVLQAAIEGHGVALARSVMAQDDLAAGRLVRLFREISCPSPLAYYIVYRADHAGRPRLSAFRNWLLREAQISAGGAPRTAYAKARR